MIVVTDCLILFVLCYKRELVEKRFNPKHLLVQGLKLNSLKGNLFSWQRG